MTSLRQRIRRFEAPVEYEQIRGWLQRVRAGAAATVAAACIVGALLDVPAAWLPAAMALVVMAHALFRSRTPHHPIESLLVDAVAVAVGLGVVVDSQVALVAAASYLVATSITFGGLTALLASLAALGTASVARALLPLPAPTDLPAAGDAIVWLATAVFLGGVALALIAAAGAVHDARARQQEALEAQRRAASMKSEFVSMVTHELRTPLTNIAGFADTLAEAWKELPDDDVDEFLQIMVSESEHLQNLVEDVLAIPRLEAGRLLLETTEFQLRPAAFKIVNLVFPDGGDRTASVAIGGNVVVHADPNRVEQVLRNLLENARKYGGDQVTVEAVSRGDDWQIVVADTGPGLPAADRERVFAPFEQVTTGDSRTGSGFGLGLAIARNLIEAMGGRIWYEPGFPVGARFCFTLPAAKSSADTDSAAEVA